MNEMVTPFRLTSLAHGGGCGCKIAPGVLTEILKAAPLRLLPGAAVGECHWRCPRIDGGSPLFMT